jgi:hypothetical protein
VAFVILDADTRSAVAAADSQTAERDAMLAPWEGGSVRMRVLGTGGVLRQTQTLGAWVTGGTDPLNFSPGARSAWTHSSTGDIERLEFRLLDETPIFSIDAQAGIGSAAVDFVGVIRQRCPVKVSGLVFTADDALPVGTPLAAFDTGINGVWTWFTTPVSHYSNGATYFAPVDSTGNSEIHRYDHAAQTTASFTLSASPDVDDHNNGSVEILDDGRIIAYWTTHYDAAVRYRVSSSADSVAAFGTLQSLTPPAGNVTYPVITRLSAAGGKRWLFYRNNNGTTQDLSFRTSADFSLGAGSASAHVALCTTAGFTPYWRIACNDSNRIDVVLVNFHPVQGDNEVYHFYAAPNGSGDLEFFRTNGTQITASLPFDIAAQCTQVVTGEVRRKWIWDIVRRPSGEVWVLWTRFMDFAGTDHRLMFSRCTSAGVWQAPVEIVAQGQYLYSGERYYSPGACFDSMDPTTIYLSAPVSGVNQIQRWRTTDSGATWTQQQVYTSGGTAGNPQRARPFSPKNHNGEVPLLWWQGRYTTYLDYDTNIWGAR